jgi:hypothetical protein
MRYSASSQRTDRRQPRPSRASGVRRRSGCASVAAAVQPLMHSAPLLTGNAASPSIGRAVAPFVMRRPHWKAQHGQCITLPGVPGIHASDIVACFLSRTRAIPHAGNTDATATGIHSCAIQASSTRAMAGMIFLGTAWARALCQAARIPCRHRARRRAQPGTSPPDGFPAGLRLTPCPNSARRRRWPGRR